MAKDWSWSYSKKKNRDTCPKRHYEVDIAKNFTDDTEQLRWGNEVHKALAAAVLNAKGIPSAGTGRDRIVAAPLPATMKPYQCWIDVIAESLGEISIERKYAITRQFAKTDWFADDVWYRGIADLLEIKGDVATALDWKTGRAQHDSVQLMLMATCIFIHHPEVNTVKTRFIWLKDTSSTPEVFCRATIMKHWTGLLPQINQMEQDAKAMHYPPKPGYLCRRHCPVTSCPHHGK
jgi:hypothetical protein